MLKTKVIEKLELALKLKTEEYFAVGDTIKLFLADEQNLKTRSFWFLQKPIEHDDASEMLKTGEIIPEDLFFSDNQNAKREVLRLWLLHYFSALTDLEEYRALIRFYEMRDDEDVVHVPNYLFEEFI